MGLPNALRSLHVVERDLQRRARRSATAVTAIESRSCGRLRISSCRPRPTSPITSSGGTRDVVEEQLRRVLRLAADLLELAPAREALGVGVDGEQRQPPARRSFARATITRSAWMPLGHERLGAAQPPVRRRPTSRRRGDRAQVRARAGLGHGDRRHDVARGDARQPARALLVVGQLGQVRHDDVVDEREVVRDRAGVGALLVDDRVEAEVLDPEPAVLLRRREGDEALLRPPCARSRGRSTPAASHSSVLGTASLRRKPRTDSRKSSCSGSKIVLRTLDQRRRCRGRRRSTWSPGRSPCRRPRARAGAS